MKKEKLEKIYIDLPDDEVIGGESLWAKPLGYYLYEIRNVPFFAYDIHFYDIVKAVPDSPEEKPRVLKVIKRSGHKTLRIIFKRKNSARKKEVLKTLEEMFAFNENMNDKFYSIDVEPQGDYTSVCDYLWELEEQGVLEYETGTK